MRDVNRGEYQPRMREGNERAYSNCIPNPIEVGLTFQRRFLL